MSAAGEAAGRDRARGARRRGHRRVPDRRPLRAHLADLHHGRLREGAALELRRARRHPGRGARAGRRTSLLLATAALRGVDGRARGRVRGSSPARRSAAICSGRSSSAIHAICQWCVGNDVVIATLAVLCSARFLREPADRCTRWAARRMTRRGCAALRGDVRDLGHPVPDDPRRGAGADAGDARLRAHGARRAAPAAGRGVAAELRPLLRVWWPLLVYTVIEIGDAVAPARARRDEADELADRAADRGRAARRRRRRRGSPATASGSERGAGSACSSARRRRGARRSRPRQRRARSPVAEVGAVAVCYAIGPIILVARAGGRPGARRGRGLARPHRLVYAPHRGRPGTRSRPRASVCCRSSDWRVICTALAFLVFFALIAEVGPVACDGHHLRQSRGRRASRRHDPRREAHSRHGRRLRRSSSRAASSPRAAPERSPSPETREETRRYTPLGTGA